MEAADAAADRLVAGVGGDLLARLAIAGGAIERQRFRLNLRRAEHNLSRAGPSRFILCESQPPARNAPAARIGIDILAAQLHRAAASRLDPEHAHLPIVRARVEEGSLPRTVI